MKRKIIKHKKKNKTKQRKQTCECNQGYWKEKEIFNWSCFFSKLFKWFIICLISGIIFYHLCLVTDTPQSIVIILLIFSIWGIIIGLFRGFDEGTTYTNTKKIWSPIEK